MDFFKFLMISFDALAWPIFALGYPLVASVRAIETNSDSDCRKLVTYWILFSLISLFEHIFMGLLEWVLVWDYVKLMIVCWLMIPRFDGAFHVYNNFVHPCLSIDLQTIIKCFIKLNDLFAKKENFVTEAEKYVKANGSEALEKLISTKLSSITPPVQKEMEAPGKQVGMSSIITPPVQKGMEAPAKQDGMSEGIEPCIMQKDSEKAYASQDVVSLTSQVLEKKVVTAVKQIPEAELNVASVSNKIPPPVEIKEAAIPEISTLPQVQKEWTCAMCQVTVLSERTLMYHLEGRRHKATCEKLKNAKNQASKDNGSVPSASKSSKTPGKEPANCASSSSTTHEESNQTSGRRRARKSDPTKESTAKGGGDKIKPETNQQKAKGQQEIENSKKSRKERRKCASSNSAAHNESNQTTGRRQAEKSDIPKERPAKSVGDKMPKCKVKAQQEIEKNKFVQVKDNKFWCSICNVSCTGADNMVSHLGAKKHLSRIQN